MRYWATRGTPAYWMQVASCVCILPVLCWLSSILLHTWPICTEDDVILPRCMLNRGINEIGQCELEGQAFLRVVIPHGIQRIGGGAFADCIRLETVAIPDSVKTIGGGAFWGCTNLERISIGAGVTTIEDDAFWGCTRLKAFEVHNRNLAYCSVDGVLFDKNMTTLVWYPAGRVGAYSIPIGVTSIGASAVRECLGLTCLYIPASVTNFADADVSESPLLTEIHFMGDKPVGHGGLVFAFYPGSTGTVYYFSGTKEWNEDVCRGEGAKWVQAVATNAVAGVTSPKAAQ